MVYAFSIVKRYRYQLKQIFQCWHFIPRTFGVINRSFINFLRYTRSTLRTSAQSARSQVDEPLFFATTGSDYNSRRIRKIEMIEPRTCTRFHLFQRVSVFEQPRIKRAILKLLENFSPWSWTMSNVRPNSEATNVIETNLTEKETRRFSSLSRSLILPLVEYKCRRPVVESNSGDRLITTEDSPLVCQQ